MLACFIKFWMSDRASKFRLAQKNTHLLATYKIKEQNDKITISEPFSHFLTF